MRHVRTFICVLVLIAPATRGQDCKRLFANAIPQPHKAVELSPEKLQALEKRRLCLKKFPWTEEQLERIEAGHGFPSAPELAALRSEMQRTVQVVKLQKAREQFGGTSSELGLAFRLSGEDWYGRLPKHMQRFARDLVLGVEPADAENFATYFYYRVLERDGKYAVIAGDPVAKRVKVNDVPRIREISQLDENTYFGSDVLKAMVYLQTIEARARTTTSAGELLEILVAHDAAPHEALGALGQEFGGRAAIEERLVDALTADPVVTTQTLLGIHRTPEGADYYMQLRGQSPRLIRYLREEASIELQAGKAAFNALEETVARDLKRANADAITLANVMRDGNKFRIQLAGADVPLTGTEYATLKAGQPLAAAHPLSKLLESDKPFVIYSNPLMRGGKYLADAEELGFALQAAYPRALIVRDDYTDATEDRAIALHDLGPTAPTDFVAVVDDGSFKVKDFNILRDIKVGLRTQGWSVIDYKPGAPWNGGSDKAVIVITGHVDKSLAAFIRELGRGGYFRNNFVVLNTCYTDQTTKLVAEINQNFGARATLRYDGKIRPDHVGELLTGVATETARPEQRRPLRDLLNEQLRAMQLRALWIICAREDSHEVSVKPRSAAA